MAERKYGPLEIQEEWKRELAAQALTKLWDAMELSRRRGSNCINLPGEPSGDTREMYYQIYHFVGKMLLGEGYPTKLEDT